MSLIHPAISLSGCGNVSRCFPGLKIELVCEAEGRTDQAHQCVIIVFLFATPIVLLLGASHTHTMVVRHRVTQEGCSQSGLGPVYRAVGRVGSRRGQ